MPRTGIVMVFSELVCSANKAPSGVLIAKSTKQLITARFDSLALLNAEDTSSAIGILWNARDHRKPC